jgi:hypothetical protein
LSESDEIRATIAPAMQMFVDKVCAGDFRAAVRVNGESESTESLLTALFWVIATFRV